MPASIIFQHRTARHELAWGSHFALPREAGFRDTSTEELRAIVNAIQHGQPWRQVIDGHYAVSKPWLHQIIRSPSRTAFVGPVLPVGNGTVLDIGAGWGQIARPLAATRPVVALEPVSERMAFIRAAAQQDGITHNLAYLETDYVDVEFQTSLDAICVIGVLEWAGANQNEVEPQERQRQFLRKTHRELSADGTLVVGIENRLGLKYLLGCPDDHIGIPDVASLPARLAQDAWQQRTGQRLQSFTYSLVELERLLHECGFAQLEFFGAFPDYKLPQQIIPFGARGDTLNQWIATANPPQEHDGYHGTPVAEEFQTLLSAHYRSLAESGIAHHFVPSFFVKATK